MSATITGTVTDPSGAVVPNAKVVATNAATGARFTGTTNSAGLYVIQMPLGTYNVVYTAPGFKKFVAAAVILEARAIRSINPKLAVGKVATTVTVKGGAQLISTVPSGLSDSKNFSRLDTIPMGHRSVWSVLALTPGVLNAGDGSSTVRFAGSQVNQANWTNDGFSFSNPYDGTQMGTVVGGDLSYIKELRVDYVNNSADIGALGQVTIITASGTNRFHGAVFDYYQSHGLRARNPFAAQSTLGDAHWPLGFNVGGPVYLPKIYNGKDKTFFFIDWETGKGSQTDQTFIDTVPTQAMQNGNFSTLCTSGFNARSVSGIRLLEVFLFPPFGLCEWNSEPMNLARRSGK